MRAAGRREQGFRSPPGKGSERCRASAASYHEALTDGNGKVAFQEQR